MRNFAGVGIVALLFAFAQTVIADDKSDLIDATDPEKLVAVIQDMGYRAKLDVDNIGDPVIFSSADGVEFAILFFGCNKKNVQCARVFPANRPRGRSRARASRGCGRHRRRGRGRGGPGPPSRSWV